MGRQGTCPWCPGSGAPHRACELWLPLMRGRSFPTSQGCSDSWRRCQLPRDHGQCSLKDRFLEHCSRVGRDNTSYYQLLVSLRGHHFFQVLNVLKPCRWSQGERGCEEGRELRKCPLDGVFLGRSSIPLPRWPSLSIPSLQMGKLRPSTAELDNPSLLQRPWEMRARASCCPPAPGGRVMTTPTA